MINMKLLISFLLVFALSCNDVGDKIRTPEYNRDVKLLASIIRAECGICDDSEKMKVGSVVLNRVDSPLFPNSIKKVITEDNQFHGHGTKNFYVDKSCLQVAEALMRGEGRVYGILYFWGDRAENEQWTKKMKDRIIYTERYHYYAN